MVLGLGLGLQYIGGGDSAEDTAPSAFTSGQWTLTNPETGETLTVTISALPSNGGSVITDIEYRVDGGTWVSSGESTTGSFNITGLTNDVEYDVEIRAVNAIGSGDASDVKSATPTAPFSPDDIADITLWLDAADTGTISETGGAVSAWADKSGQSHNATQGTGANQPETGGTINGNNCLVWAGSKWMDIPDDAIAYGPATIFAVFQPDNAFTNRYIMGCQGGGGSQNRFYTYTQGIDYGQTPLLSAAPISGETIIQASWVLGTGTTTQALKVGEAAVISGAVSRMAIGAELNIGSFSEGESAFFTGLLGEIIAYNRNLTTDEKNDVGTYLAAKWGGAWSNI